MKKAYFIVIAFFLSMLVYTSCRNEEVKPGIKDLGRHMMDAKIYQENLGDEIRAANFDNAEWLVEGLDSVLKVVAREVREHRKLKKPFSYYYDHDMRRPLQDIRKGIMNKDTMLAGRNYRTLVMNCDGCHVDNEVDEIVRF